MVEERKGLLKLGEQDVTIVGPDVKAGDYGLDFQAMTQDWRVIDVLEEHNDKVKIIAAVPSLETSICDRETRQFNQAASELDEDIVIITISADLPYTQARWCGAAGIDRVLVVSDHYSTDFATKYGCLIKERRILRRAVFILDRTNRVVYAEYMPALGVEPDYGAVLAAARKALG
jgi:thiol peroxidase